MLQCSLGAAQQQQAAAASLVVEPLLLHPRWFLGSPNQNNNNSSSRAVCLGRVPSLVQGHPQVRGDQILAECLLKKGFHLLVQIYPLVALVAVQIPWTMLDCKRTVCVSAQRLYLLAAVSYLWQT